MVEQSRSVDTRSIWQRLLSLSTPIIGINILTVLMLTVDSALCGRLPDADVALGALGYSTQIVLVLMVAVLGLIVGTVALVARAYGAGAIDRIGELLAQSTQLMVLVGALVGLIGYVVVGPLLELLGGTPAVVEVGTRYLRPLMLGMPLLCLNLLYTGILRGVGNTKIPFACALGANVVNAILNYGLVLGHLGLPALGVTGSAIGTVIAQGANVAALVYLLRRGRIPSLRLRFAIVPVDRKLAVELFRVGWPAALDMLVLQTGFLIGLGFLGRIDATTVAAHGLGLRVQSLAFVPGYGIAQATAALVGQALGAASIEQARQIARASMVLCTALMSGLAIVIVLLAAPIVHLFDVAPGTPLEHYAIEWMRLLGAAMLPAGIVIALIGLLQGSGATRTSLRINAWTTFVIQIPLSYVLAFPAGLGETGVWLSFPIVFIAKAVVVYLAYRRERWAVTGVRVAS